MPAIDKLFDQMLSTGASDLHMHEGQAPKLRLHGALTPIPAHPAMDQPAMVRYLKEICPADKWQRYEATGDLDFAYSYADRARFRANYKKHVHGYGAVFRTIPSHIQTLDEINAPPILRSFAEYTSGLVLMTGPTGSGKSTTLAALIDHINTTQRRTILTIEEPIEFVHQHKLSTVVQREVGTDTPSFGHALRGALRQDVQVVLVGEMRDLETIALAVTAAEMGLLVFGTLHTNSAAKTIDRIIDVFPSVQQNPIRQSLAVALRAVCAQLLLKRADGKGRIASHEILIQNRAVSNMIREGKTGQLAQAMMSGRQQGMQLMDDTLEGHFKTNTITGRDAYMKALDKDRFRQFAPLGE